MNWIEEAAARLKKKNQILFTKGSEYMQDLILLFQSQSHRVISLWAFDFAEESISLLGGKYPEECRPKEALDAAKDWAAGRIDMRMAQRKILDCHAFSKEIVAGKTLQGVMRSVRLALPCIPQVMRSDIRYMIYLRLSINSV